MKSLRIRISLLVLAAAMILAHPYLNSPVIESNQDSDTEKQAQVKKEKTNSCFPFVFAGTISIIRKVYLKKAV